VPILLLDVNILLPLFWPPHENHRRIQEWFQRHSANGWATCPFTETAFLRLVSNPQFSPDSVTPMHAETVLAAGLKHPNHHFWPDDLSVSDAIAPLRRNLVGHRQITDAYLLGLVIFRRGKLVTLDAGITSLLPREIPARSVVELL
jgi:toxin-antitoxin system PIN domain toxin